MGEVGKGNGNFVSGALQSRSKVAKMFTDLCVCVCGVCDFGNSGDCDDKTLGNNCHKVLSVFFPLRNC